MRIEVILSNSRPTRIPINYNHPLAAGIYETLGSSCADYASRLHNQGYEFKGKHFKLFTFSQLLAPRCRALGDQLLIQADTVRWLISSPVEEFIIHFVNGVLDRGHVRINEISFPVREVHAIAEPKFTERMRFRCLSPITVSTHINAEGLNQLQYCRLEDGFYEKVADNLRRKQALLASQMSSLTSEFSSWDMEFDPLVRARRKDRIYKLITYKDTKIFCYQCPFTVEGSPELMRIGYQCGFGDGNSKGFGMVEVTP
jgi:CRISPR-associated endoribonuclease Cas6